MRSDTFRKTALAALVSAATLALPMSANAQDVKLKTLDGRMTVTGILQSYANGFYIIQTKLGTFRIEIDKSVCEGIGCPFTMT